MCSLLNFFHTTLNPAMYHGHYKVPPFFEGWYYKLVNASETQRFAIIPGIYLGEAGHAFIQVLNGNLAESSYHRFEAEAFWASKDSFQIRIGQNYFSDQGIQLNIDDEKGQVRGELQFVEIKPWPVTLKNPGIMGWYAWVPKMECYHGVLSMDHELRGTLDIYGKTISFNQGRGYTEKDWGQSFPAVYIWFQCNHFQTVGVSLTASVAIIPWLGSAFPGFIVGFLFRNELHRFATYLGSKIDNIEIRDEQVTWAVTNRTHRLEMKASRAEGGLLHEPTRREMLQRVEETLQAKVEVRLSTLAGESVTYQKGRNGGLEVQGDIPRLVGMS